MTPFARYVIQYQLKTAPCHTNKIREKIVKIEHFTDLNDARIQTCFTFLLNMKLTPKRNRMETK